MFKSEIKEFYDFSDRGINIDSSHRCPLECPKCQRQAILKRGHKVPGRDMPWEDLIKIAKFFKKGLIFCGQISDPSANPLMIDILKYCYEHKIPIGLNTAASHKPVKWYKKAFEANRKAHWIFGIDGLQSSYNTGRGRVIMRAKTTIDELPNGKEVIIVNEIPYQVNKTKIIEQIANLINSMATFISAMSFFAINVRSAPRSAVSLKNFFVRALLFSSKLFLINIPK